jgi:hypothetical protein
LTLPIIEPSLHTLIAIWLYIAVGIALGIYGIATLISPTKQKPNKECTPSVHMTDKGRRFHPVLVEYINGKENYCVYSNPTFITYEEAYNAAVKLLKSQSRE